MEEEKVDKTRGYCMGALKHDPTTELSGSAKR